MEVSVIYEMLEQAKLGDYRKKLEKEDNNFTKWEREDKEKLEKSLNEEQSKLLQNYLNSLNLLKEDIDYQIGIRTLNYGIKIGIQLQKSIKDLYNYFDEPDYYE